MPISATGADRLRFAGPRRLVFLPRAPGGAVRHLLVEHGGAIARGVMAPGEAPPWGADPVVLVVPGEEVLARRLNLPARRDAQAAAAASFLLEEDLAGDREALHVAVGPSEPGGERLALVVDRQRMQSWLDRAAEFGLDPAAVTPDFMLVPDHEGGLALRVEGAYAVGGADLLLTCEADLLPVVLGARELRRVDDPVEVEALLAEGAGRDLVDLRQGGFAPARRRRGGRDWTLALAAGLAASLVLMPLIQAGRQDLAARAAEAEIAALAGPQGAGEPADPLSRLRARNARQDAAAGFPAAASAVMGAVQRVEGMEVEDLLYGDDGAFRLSLAHANYSDIDLLRAGLDAAGYQLEETSTDGDPGAIMSDVVARPAP